MYLKIGIIFCTLIVQIVTEPCLTPNNQTAECIPLYSCPILIGALASQQNVSIEFVRESNCGGTGKNPMVCCGTLSNFTMKEDSTTNQSKNVSKISLLPSSQFCGYQHADDYYREPNDTTIRITEFPWSARIKYKNRNSSVNSQDNFFCIGTLINRRYVLTAAHCLVNKQGRIPEAVHLGDYNIINKTDCVQEPPFDEECSEPVQEVAIEKLIPHPLYSTRKMLHDIALLRLTRKVSYSDYIRPICLPFPERKIAKNGDTLISTGWAKANFNDDVVEIKKKNLKKMIANDECAKVYRMFTKPRKVDITEHHLCAILLNNDTTFECYGDSGGPLMFSHSNQWQQEGIISFGVARCGREYPDVYTNVKKYLDWILYVIEP